MQVLTTSIGVAQLRDDAIARRAYVADNGNSRIARINDVTGAGWTTFGTPGSGPNQFTNPYWIFVR